jgi:transcriptional regulator with XRE-family HTH domain
LKISPRKARELRERAMLSQEELAEKVGVSAFTVWRWEQGDEPVGIRPRTGRKLVQVLNAEPAELLPGVDAEEHAAEAALKAVEEQVDRDAAEFEAAGGRVIRLSDEDGMRLRERVDEGDTEGLEAEATQLKALYQRAVREYGPDGNPTPRLADALATILAALALAHGGTLEDVKGAILRALEAHREAHTAAEGN